MSLSRRMPAPTVLAVLSLAVGGCGSGREQAATSTAPAKLKETTTKSGLELVLLRAGEFIMGDDGGAKDERPAHKVKLDAFWVAKYEITQQLYKAVIGKNPSKRQGDRDPVEQVSWYDAIQFCNLVSQKEGLKPCYDTRTGRCDFAANGYRLPTEAEWEYACRAGARTRYSFGDGAAALGDYGWFKGNSGDTLHPVGQKKPNGWGLADMHGGVFEWCNDIYAKTYDAKAAENPRGPGAGDERVLRGGSWRSTAEACRSSARHYETPAFADVCFNADLYGFRCVRNSEAADWNAARR